MHWYCGEYGDESQQSNPSWSQQYIIWIKTISVNWNKRSVNVTDNTRCICNMIPQYIESLYDRSIQLQQIGDQGSPQAHHMLNQVKAITSLRLSPKFLWLLFCMCRAEIITLEPEAPNELFFSVVVMWRKLSQQFTPPRHWYYKFSFLGLYPILLLQVHPFFHWIHANL